MADIFDQLAASNSLAPCTTNQPGKTNVFDQFDPKTAVPVEEYSTAQLNAMDALSKDPNVPKDSEIGNRYILDQISFKMLNNHLTAGQAWKQYQWEQKVSTFQEYGAITLFCIFVLGAILAAILLIRWIGRMIRTATNRGRYQIENATPEGCYVLDTTTGEVTWKPRSNL